MDERVWKTIFILLESYVEIVKERFGGHLRAVAVFGSAARGEAVFPQSDIDLIFILEGLEGTSIGGRLDMFKGLRRNLSETRLYDELRKLVGSSVLIAEHILTPKEFTSHPPIVLDLVTDSKILYDTGFLEKELEKLRSRLRELGAERVKLHDGSWYWKLKDKPKLGEEIVI